MRHPPLKKNKVVNTNKIIFLIMIPSHKQFDQIVPKFHLENSLCLHLLILLENCQLNRFRVRKILFQQIVHT
jgi:hypothetical protein